MVRQLKNHKPRIVFACGREPGYVRNAMLHQTLSHHFDLKLIGDSNGRSISRRLARLAPALLYQLRQPHDLVVIGFLGHPLVPLVRRFTRAPILFDPFVSVFDTLSPDRNLFPPESLWARLCFALDRVSLRLADRVLSDTLSHANYYQQTFAVPAAKLANLYLGCDQQIFYPRKQLGSADDFTVFTYCTYLPLHGVETVVKAAALCQAYPIRFRIVGDQGPVYRQVRALAANLQLTNIEFVPSLPFVQLPQEIANAAICLGGHFGATAKAARVIAGKTYQFMAMARPVILGDNPANHELFQHGINAYFCPPDQPEALAGAIEILYRQPALRETLAQNAFHLFQTQLNWCVLGDQLRAVVQAMV